MIELVYTDGHGNEVLRHPISSDRAQECNRCGSRAQWVYLATSPTDTRPEHVGEFCSARCAERMLLMRSRALASAA